MLKWIAVFAFLLILATAALSLGESGELRIVSLLPSMTETAYALGLGKYIVGVSDFDDYPPEVKSKPKVGGFLNTNFEAVMALRPTVVLLDGKLIGHVEKFRQLGIRTVPAPITSMVQVFDSIMAIGNATGTTPRAQKMLADIKQELEAIRTQASTHPRVSTLVVIGHDPGSLNGLFAAAEGSWNDELLQIAGGTNCVGKTLVPYPQLSKEVLIKKNPECILVLAPDADGSPAAVAKEKALWAKLGSIDAVKKGRIYLLTDSWIQKPGPRMPLAARKIAQTLHPDWGTPVD